MNTRAVISGAVIVLLLCTMCAGQETGSPADRPNLDAYKAELQHWLERVGALDGQPRAAQKLRAEIPKVLVVVANDARFEPGTHWLDAALSDYIAAKPEQRAGIVQQVQARLKVMQEQADEFQRPSPATGTRGKLEDILSRREFNRVHGPSALDTLREKISRWLFRVLEKIFSSVPTQPQAGQILVWLAIAVGTAALAIWLKRKAARGTATSFREIIPFAPSARNWRQWLAEARAAAQNGQWRDAIHLAYWAGVSHLEESGAWVPDRARTPREYLRLLPSLSDKRPPLSELTTKFEVVWYGGCTAGAEDFTAAISNLERLGCR